MNTITLRPEDRQRSGRDSALDAPWADTLRACFRSEAFPEDLDVPVEAPAAPRAGRPLRRSALSTALAWGILPGLATR